MGTSLKSKVYQLCKLCMALGIFFYNSRVSGIFFGEPDFPFEETAAEHK